MSGGEREQQILELIRAIPEGFVTTYSDLCPEAPRYPGRVLSDCEDPDLPWHRVVRADGSFAQGERQRELLEGEAIPFVRKRVDMDSAHIPRDALLVEVGR